MAPPHRRPWAVWLFWRFLWTASHFLPQFGRYHGMYACAFDPLDAQASPPMQVCHSGAQEQDPKHPWKGPFWGVQVCEQTQIFLWKFIFWRTTNVDHPAAPWPHHKPEFSNFGSASPKWHSHAEPQRTQFWTGGSICHNYIYAITIYSP